MKSEIVEKEMPFTIENLLLGTLTAPVVKGADTLVGPRYGDIEVCLELCSSRTVVASTRSNVHGRFAFANLLPGSYAVRVKNTKQESSEYKCIEVVASIYSSGHEYVRHERILPGHHSKKLRFIVHLRGAEIRGSVYHSK